MAQPVTTKERSDAVAAGCSGGRRGAAGPDAPLAARHFAVIIGTGSPKGTRRQLRRMTGRHTQNVIAAPACCGGNRSSGAACLTRRTAARENQTSSLSARCVCLSLINRVLPACTRARTQMSTMSWLLALDALHVAVVRGPTPYCPAKPARACAPAAPPGARRATTAGDGRKADAVPPQSDQCEASPVFSSTVVLTCSSSALACTVGV